MAEILVVDDEIVSLKVLRNILTNAGHHVVCAADGMKALSVLEDNPQIEMLITDVIMPRLDGRDLVAALQRDPKRKNLPTIIMSATVRVSEIVRLLESGASRFLAKPVNPERLLQEVEACLRPPADPASAVPTSN
jgi:CheY-like chemotaxis protein